MKRMMRLGHLSSSASLCARAPVASSGSRLSKARRLRFITASQLQELPGILVIDFVFVFGRQAHLIDEFDAFFFQHKQWRGIRTEDEVIGAHSFESATGARNRVTGRF